MGHDELEALRLADLEGLYQADAALKMGVSRQTFGNIVESARNKVADVLVNGRALRIQGGSYQLTDRTFTCSGCGREWAAPPGTGSPRTCPHCRANAVRRAPAPGPCAGRPVGGKCQGNGGKP